MAQGPFAFALLEYLHQFVEQVFVFLNLGLISQYAYIIVFQHVCSHAGQGFNILGSG